MPCVVSIVEGHGEVDAVPVLVWRIAQAVDGCLAWLARRPIRVKSGSFLQDDGYFKRYIQLAATRAAEEGGVVLILIDCDDGCPKAEGPQILARAQGVRSDVDYIVALAYREYETWFLAAAVSLRGCSGLPDDLEPPPEPEVIRGAKEWLGQRMPGGYDPIRHQTSFSAQFDLDSAAAVPSFNRLRTRLADYFNTH